MNVITLNSQGFAEQSGFVVCYQVDSMGVFTGVSNEYIPATSGLPAGAYADEPPKPLEGHVVVRAATGWEQVEDNRGKKAYSILDGSEWTISELGPLPSELVASAPESPFDKWDGVSWVMDMVAKRESDVLDAKAKKNTLLASVTEKIAPLKDALEGGYIEESDKPVLSALQKYRYELTKTDTTLIPVSFPVFPS